MRNYSYIAKFCTLAKQEYTDQKPGLSRIRKFLNSLDNPQDHYPVIHVAGTNGKGSTANMIQSILTAGGFKIGLYTSPHFLDCRERIQINKQMIPKKSLEKLLAIAFASPLACKLTYFEILTSIAFQYFADEKIDILVAEVGLGGRYDATNIVKNKIASIITSIDFDHTEILGNDLMKIAAEKAGIIKSNVPVIANTGHKKTDLYIQQISQEKNCPLYILGRDFSAKYQNTDWAKQKQIFSYRGIATNYDHLELNFFGEHQIRNACLALACIETLPSIIKINSSTIYRGLKTVYWPGRFEILRKKIANKKRIVILDGAHNAAGAKIFKDTLLKSPYAKNKIVLVTSILREKDYKKMCKEFSKISGKVMILKIASPRALPPEVLINEWQKYLPKKCIFSITDFSQLGPLLKNNDQVIAITGSLYAIAAARGYCNP